MRSGSYWTIRHLSLRLKYLQSRTRTTTCSSPRQTLPHTLWMSLRCLTGACLGHGGQGCPHACMSCIWQVGGAFGDAYEAASCGFSQRTLQAETSARGMLYNAKLAALKEDMTSLQNTLDTERKVSWLQEGCLAAPGIGEIAACAGVSFLRRACLCGADRCGMRWRRCCWIASQTSARSLRGACR